MFFFLYQVFGYRKSTVRGNLINSFPEKTPNEITQIERAFYAHLCDITLENIKLFSITKKEALNRFKLKNPELMDMYFEKGLSIIMVSAHYNNWEMVATIVDLYVKHQCIGIYSPLKDKYFDKKMRDSREKFGMQMLPKSLVPRSFVNNKNKPTITIFAADQSPTFSKQVYWLKFLHQDTAVFIGSEVFALKYNYPVIFLNVTKPKRGFYEAEAELLVDNPAETQPGEITELHSKRLEQEIIKKPEFWLWSHKRWKRKMTEEERGKMEFSPA